MLLTSPQLRDRARALLPIDWNLPESLVRWESNTAALATLDCDPRRTGEPVCFHRVNGALWRLVTDWREEVADAVYELPLWL
jgi:hypothetical protein